MPARSLTFRSLGLAFGAALFLGAPLHAQATALSTVADSAVSAAPAAAEVAPAVAGPTRDAATVAVRHTAAADAAAPQPATRGHDRGTALMIVGGAAILTGLVIGNGAGYAISVAGAVVGLYGLYQYLQ
ncbi:hypothetical protein BH11GEM1_BH11GEM1_21890 [soil metagenome]